MVTHKFEHPPRWSESQLRTGSAKALERFIESREGPKAYARHFAESLEEVEDLFDSTGNLRQFDAKTFTIRPDLVRPARFLGGPPISEDDLETLVEARIGKSIKHGLANRIAKVLRSTWDPLRFPWLDSGKPASRAEVRAATRWTASIWAIERTRTEMRNEPAKKQQASVASALMSYGYSEVPRPAGRHIRSLDVVPRGSFMRNGFLGGKDCDVAVRLHDGRMLAIECKVSNSSVNSVKRLINDAGGKSDIWRREFGDQVVAAAVLAGVFNLINLTEAQSQHSLFLIWEHNLGSLEAFLKATTT